MRGSRGGPGRRPPRFLAPAGAAVLGCAAPGIYGNNCICRDTASGERKFYEGDAKALREFGFDGFKPDGCGAQADMQLWDDVFMPDVGPPVMVENCYWGSKVLYEPTETWCPWNFSSRNLSTPGCWAYPDLLEVGCQQSRRP